MRQGVDESRTEWIARRRRRSALLSGLAAGITALLFIASGIWGHTNIRWLVAVSVPPIMVSTAAAYQYGWETYTGAGAAAAVVFWVWAFEGTLSSGPAFLIGAILQTCAWYLSRPGRDTTDVELG